MKPNRLPNQFSNLVSVRSFRLQWLTAGNGEIGQLIGRLQSPPESRIEFGEQPFVHREQARFAAIQPSADQALGRFGILGREGFDPGEMEARHK